MTVIDEKILEKYRKVKALAERGEGGEKKTAQKVLSRMERNYPGIKEEASAEEEIPPEPNRPHWSDLWKKQQDSRSWQDHVKNFTHAASGAFEWASHFAGEAFSVHEAQRLAQHHVKITPKDHQTGALACNIRIPPEVAQRVYQQFTDEQITVFVNTLSQRMASELFFHIVGEEDGQEGAG